MAALIDNHVQVFSAANVTSLTSASWTIGGTNRRLYHQVGSGASSVANPNACKIGGSGGTSLSTIGTTQDLGANGKHTLYALTDPAAGSTTSYVSWASNQDETFLIGVSTKDTDQTTPNNTVASATGTNVSPTASATSVSGDLVLGFMFYLDSGANEATWTRGGQTVLETIRDASTPYEGIDAAYQTAAGTSTAASWSISGTGALDEWGVFALAVNAATGGGGGSTLTARKALLGVGL